VISFFDYLVSIFLLIIFFPLIIIISIILAISNGLPLIYHAKRVGLRKKEIIVYKFRSMIQSDGDGVTLNSDLRVTKTGYILRKFKLDELPQLFNICLGNLSLVGPRPENIKYFKSHSYLFDYLNHIKPGIIDLVTLIFVNESKYLESESFYINKILPLKSKIHNKIYAKYKVQDFIVPIFLTPVGIFFPLTVQKIVLNYCLSMNYLDFQDREQLRLFISIEKND